MKVQSFRDLLVWQKSVYFIDEIHRLTRGFPAEERFILTAQLKKSALSIASNIAEGSGRFTSRDYLGFISNSRGSVKESESHLLVATRLEFLTESRAATALGLTDEMSRLLFNLRESIRKQNRRAGT
jgi:four helix bundle protein